MHTYIHNKYKYIYRRKSPYALRILTMYKHTQYIWLSFYIPENCIFVWMIQFVRKCFHHQNTESFLSGDSTGKQEQWGSYPGKFCYQSTGNGVWFTGYTEKDKWDHCNKWTVKLKEIVADILEFSVSRKRKPSWRLQFYP